MVFEINLNEYKSIRSFSIAFYLNGGNLTNFGSFGVKHIPNEIKKPRENKTITTNIYRIQANNSVMCEYFWMGLIDFIQEYNRCLNHLNLFQPYKYGKNDKVILKHFK